jgi:hypothetical protein
MRRTPLRVAIPEDMRKQLAQDPFMRRCIVDDGECEGRTEWDHAFSYAGRRQNEVWGILPMCSAHHGREAAYRPQIAAVMRQRLAHFGMEQEAREKYPKSLLVIARD